MKHLLILAISSLILINNNVNCFDSDQLEVFDVVEEVKENFYTLLNVTQNATNSEIKSAFRALSLKLHPDKNPDVDTSEQFRNLVSVYEVLRSATKRKYYDEVLINGLPNWKSAVYYYRYVRKMGLLEVMVILFCILTFGQYLVNWAAYFERKYTLEQNLKRKKKKDKTLEEDLESLPKPSVFDTLPIQIPKFVFFVIVSIPSLILGIKDVVSKKLEEAKVEPVEEIEPPKPKVPRKRNKGFVLPEGPNFEMVKNSTTSKPETIQAPVSGGLWTDDDLDDLVKLIKKYPQGYNQRWQVIAEELNRSVSEVTYMANKIKENDYKLKQDEEEPVIKVKQKTKKEGLEGLEDAKNWTQSQQKALEEALLKYPKGCLERWEKIADCVPNKSKDDCIVRFRYLAENLKKQKEAVS